VSKDTVGAHGSAPAGNAPTGNVPEGEGPAYHEIRNFLDAQGRLKAWPAKRKLQLKAVELLATKFVDDLVYTEKEVNGLLNLHHTFEDPARLRRELFDLGYLGRTKDGARYWKQAGA